MNDPPARCPLCGGGPNGEPHAPGCLIGDGDGLNAFESYGFRHLWEGLEAMEAKAEVHMAEAIEAMDDIANSLTDPRCEEPISPAERKMAVLRLCGETFERLKKERAAWVAEWKRRFRPDGPKPGDKS